LTSGVYFLCFDATPARVGVYSLGGIGISPVGCLNAGSLNLPQICEALTTTGRRFVVHQSALNAPHSANNQTSLN
jgi:hypothetical protein